MAEYANVASVKNAVLEKLERLESLWSVLERRYEIVLDCPICVRYMANTRTHELHCTVSYLVSATGALSCRV